MTHNVGRLCVGWGIAFRLPVTELQFINKYTLFVLLPCFIRRIETEAGSSTKLMIECSAPLAQNHLLCVRAPAN